jgi:hypothetical protein
MFNKKIVSLISALTMALSMCSFVSVQAADAPAADFDLKVEKNIFDPDTYADGFQEYTITVTLNTENIALTDNGKAGALKRYTGSRVTSFAGKINFDTTKFYTDDTMMSGSVATGSYTLGALESGATFNWYTTKGADGLEGNVELLKINLYAMDADGNPTMGEDDEFESLFTWDTTSRLISYCEWDNVKTLTLDEKVLADNPGIAGWVGNVGIEKDEPIVPDPVLPEVTVSDKMDVAAGSIKGAAWDVTIKNFDSAKAYVAKFTDTTTNTSRDEGKAIDVAAFAETTGDVGFAVILKLTAERNVALTVDVQ